LRRDVKKSSRRTDHTNETSEPFTVLRREFMFRHLARVVVVVALGSALAAAPTAVAVAQEPPTVTASLAGAATLVAKGAAVDVEVLYSCSPDTTFANARVGLTQRVSDGRLTSGYGETDDLVCDGTEQVATVRVIGNTGLAFKEGDAVAQGAVTACNAEFICSTVGFSGTVRIR
jgi:hypothetical protein